MKTIIVHTHTTLNIPRKGKQTEPNKEQMIKTIDNQIKYFKEQLEIYECIKIQVELSKEN